MRCSVCGKEFGERLNCQNCGVDRVTGLANYRGYSSTNNDANQRYNTSQDYSSYNGGYSFPKTMVCYACSEIIPSDSEYCPHCRKKLYETCPKCGARYSSQFQVCNKCGTDRNQYYLKLEAQKAADKAKEEAEKEKKEREKKEIRVREEASELRRRLGGKALAYWWLLYLVLLCSTPFLIDGTDGTILFSLIIGGLCIGIAGQYIIIWLEKERITKWKQEHPNDPRSKYL